jgi:hypothetical protein
MLLFKFRELAEKAKREEREANGLPVGPASEHYIKRTVITGIMETATDRQKQAICDAAKIAGLEVVGLVGRADAIEYYHRQRNLKALKATCESDGRTVYRAFVDIGHTCTSIAVWKYFVEEETTEVEVVVSPADGTKEGEKKVTIVCRSFLVACYWRCEMFFKLMSYIVFLRSSAV